MKIVFMTYREATQSLEKQTWEIYDKVGGIRDHATQDEKDTWNNCRTLLRNAALEMQRLDNRITAGRAKDKLKGTY